MLKNRLREYLIREEDWGQHSNLVPPQNRKSGRTFSQDFIQKYGSQHYKEVIERVKYYTGKDISDFDSMIEMSQFTMNLLNQIQRNEQGHETELEKLAIRMVMYDFNIPKGKIEFDVKITNDIDTGREITNIDKSEVTPEAISKFKSRESFDSNVKKRRLVNALITGMAYKGHYMFHLAGKELNKIEPDLMKLYGAITSISELGHFIIPDEFTLGVVKSKELYKKISSGEVRIDTSGKLPKIIARGKTFSVLLHEIIKGVMELMSIDSLPTDEEKSKEVLKQADYFGGENQDLRYGPKLWEKFVESIPDDSMDIKSNIYHYVVSLPHREFNSLIEDIISGSSRGKEKMKQISKKVRKILSGIQEHKNINEAVIMPINFNELEQKLKSAKTLEDHKQTFNEYGIDLMGFSEFNSKGIDYLPYIKFMHAAYDPKTKRSIIIIDDNYYNDNDIKNAFKGAPIDLETALSHENIHHGQVSKWGSKKSPYKPQDPTKQKEYLSMKEEVMAISNTIVKELIKQQGLKKLSELPEQLKRNDIYWQIKNIVDQQVLNRYKKYIYLYAEKYLK